MLAINDNARNGQRRKGPGPHYGPESAQGARDCPLVIDQAPSALAARYSAVVNYTASAGHVSTRPGRRAAGDRESSLVTAAVQTPKRIARDGCVRPRRVSLVRGTACRLARRTEDGYQPPSRQDKDNQGHDEHRRRRHGGTRVRQEIPPSPPGRGCRSRSPPRYRWSGPQVVTPSWLGCLRVSRKSRAGPLKAVASRRRLA